MFSREIFKAFWGRFHQLSTYSFYARGAQMREKDSQVVSIFTLLGSTSVKAEHKCVGEIDSWCRFHQQSTSCFCSSRFMLILLAHSI